MITSEEITNPVPVEDGDTVQRCSECGTSLRSGTLGGESSGETYYLRCFVRRSPDGYIAECLDLDISAEARTVEKAIVGLQDALVGYLSVMFEDKQVAMKDVLRRSPLSHWLLYLFERIKYATAALFFEMFQAGANQRFYKVSPYTHCQI